MTLASWSKRADAGDRTLVQLPQPVNRFPDFVAHMVASLKTMLPTMGTRRIAQLLGRAGLAISASTVRRARTAQPVSQPPPATQGEGPGRSVKSTRRNQIWNVDLTTIATTGTTAPGRAGAVPPTKPFVWWTAVVLDQFSRRAIGFAVFDRQPTTKSVTKCLQRAVQRVGGAPEATITDQGVQVRSAFKRWCKRHQIRPRFGAIGQHGSIAITERFIRSMKDECLRRILVPYDRCELCAELTRYFNWYNTFRPHQGLDGATPVERWNSAKPAVAQAPFETRQRYRVKGARTNKAARCRGQPGVRLEMKVSDLADSPLLQLPVIELRQAA